MSDNISNARSEVGVTPTRFVTWNVKGMNGPNKRARILHKHFFLYKNRVKLAIQVLKTSLLPGGSGVLEGPSVWHMVSLRSTFTGW